MPPLSNAKGIRQYQLLVHEIFDSQRLDDTVSRDVYLVRGDHEAEAIDGFRETSYGTILGNSPLKAIAISLPHERQFTPGILIPSNPALSEFGLQTLYCLGIQGQVTSVGNTPVTLGLDTEEYSNRHISKRKLDRLKLFLNSGIAVTQRFRTEDFEKDAELSRNLGHSLAVKHADAILHGFEKSGRG